MQCVNSLLIHFLLVCQVQVIVYGQTLGVPVSESPAVQQKQQVAPVLALPAKDPSPGAPASELELLNWLGEMPAKELVTLMRQKVDMFRYYNLSTCDEALDRVAETLQDTYFVEPRVAELLQRVLAAKAETQKQELRNVIEADIKSYLSQKLQNGGASELRAGVAYPLLLAELDENGNTLDILMHWYQSEEGENAGAIHRFIATAMYQIAVKPNTSARVALSVELPLLRFNAGTLSPWARSSIDGYQYYGLCSEAEAPIIAEEVLPLVSD